MKRSFPIIAFTLVSSSLGFAPYAARAADAGLVGAAEAVSSASEEAGSGIVAPPAAARAEAAADQNAVPEGQAVAEKSGPAAARVTVRMSKDGLDCAAVNAQIAKLPPEGGTIILPEGNFTCDSPMVIERDNVKVIGAGSGKTVFKAKDGVALPVIIIGSPRNTDIINGLPYPDHVTKGVELVGVSTDGNYHSSPNAGDLECWNPKTNKSMSCANDSGNMIRNNGLTIRRAEDIKVRDFETKANYSGGVVTEKLCKNLLVDGFKASDNYFDGFAGYETHYSIFRNFELTGNQFSGTSADADFSRNLFENGKAHDNGDNGIFSASVNDNTYRHVDSYGNKGYAYYIIGNFNGQSEMRPGTCDGNRIEDSVLTGAKQGVYIDHLCQGVVLKDVTIKEQSDSECFYFRQGTHISVTGGSTCTDQNGNTKSIDGDYKSIDPQYQSAD